MAARRSEREALLTGSGQVEGEQRVEVGRVQVGAADARAHHGAQLVAHELRRAARRARACACASIATVSGRRAPSSTSFRRIALS